MKNKKLTYLLLPLVIIIWGTIFWKFFTGMGKKDDKIFTPIVHLSNESLKEETDTIRLSFQYNDPFLHNLRENTVAKPTANENVVRKPNIVVAWPKVEYRGSVGKHSQSKYLGLIKLSGKENLISEGDVIENMRVLNVTPDSVELEFMNDKRFFKRIDL
jgi:hypothetical protein